MIDLETPRQPTFQSIDGTDHAKCIQERAKGKDDYQHAKVGSSREESESGPQWINHQLVARHAGDNPDIVVRTRLNAIQTKGAIHVAGFARLVQCQFATALDHYQRCSGLAFSTNAIFRPATGTDLMVAHFHLERRKCRSHEVELPDRANELTECRMLE